MHTLSIKELRSAWTSNDEQSRRGRVRDLLEMYDHNWHDQLDAEINRLFLPQNAEKQRQRADTSLNLMRWTVDTLSSIYSSPISRTVDGTSDGLEPYTNEGRLDLALDRASRLLFLCRELFIRPLVVNGRVVLDILTPDNVYVLPDPFDPLAISAIVYQVEDPLRYVAWTADSHFVLDKGWKEIPQPENPESVNPYGVIPWMPLHAAYPERGFWHDQESNGLRVATMQAGLAKTDHNHLRHLQSFKQIVFTGMSDEKALRAVADPSTAIAIKNPGGSASVLDTTIDLQKHLESILTASAATLNLYGIRPEQVRGTLSASSGYALQIQLHSTERIWDQQRRIWDVWERMLYDLTSRIYTLETGQQLPIGDLNISWPDIGPPKSITEESTYYASLLDKGLISKREAMRKLFSWSDQQIDDVFLEIQKERAMFSAIPIMPQMPVMPSPDLDIETGEDLEIAPDSDQETSDFEA